MYVIYEHPSYRTIHSFTHSLHPYIYIFWLACLHASIVTYKAQNRQYVSPIFILFFVCLSHMHACGVLLLLLAVVHATHMGLSPEIYSTKRLSAENCCKRGRRNEREKKKEIKTHNKALSTVFLHTIRLCQCLWHGMVWACSSHTLFSALRTLRICKNHVCSPGSRDQRTQARAHVNTHTHSTPPSCQHHPHRMFS